MHLKGKVLPQLTALVVLLTGCRSPRVAETPTGPQLRVLTYNVNWGAPRADLAADLIRNSGADIVCLQETTPEWEQYLQQVLGREFKFMAFRNSQGRMGGGLAFLSRLPAQEVAYIPSETGWFDGWIVAFDTALGPVQLLNVHLRPPVSDSGSWVSGYFSTRDDRLQEMEKFYARRHPEWPTLVLGDFNDGENSAVLQWLEKQGLINALPEFDHSTATWEWRYRGVKLSRRMDHIVYAPALHCCSAQVIRAGASDHFPVQATFAKRIVVRSR
ncbi:MAG: endonuclease/exonuclease/phosphatase family protein [Verrucomicrobiota bacterium]